MRTAPTVRIFAVLIGFVLALPAAAEAQNSSTLRPGPVSTDNVTSSCRSANTPVDATSPAFGGFGAAVVSSSETVLSTPWDANVAAYQNQKCEGACNAASTPDCVGALPGTSCGGGGYGGYCKFVRVQGQGSGDCPCYCEVGGRRGRGPDR